MTPVANRSQELFRCDSMPKLSLRQGQFCQLNVTDKIEKLTFFPDKSILATVNHKKISVKVEKSDLDAKCFLLLVQESVIVLSQNNFGEYTIKMHVRGFGGGPGQSTLKTQESFDAHLRHSINSMESKRVEELCRNRGHFHLDSLDKEGHSHLTNAINLESNKPSEANVSSKAQYKIIDSLIRFGATIQETDLCSTFEKGMYDIASLLVSHYEGCFSSTSFIAALNKLEHEKSNEILSRLIHVIVSHKNFKPNTDCIVAAYKGIGLEMAMRLINAAENGEVLKPLYYQIREEKVILALFEKQIPVILWKLDLDSVVLLQNNGYIPSPDDYRIIVRVLNNRGKQEKAWLKVATKFIDTHATVLIQGDSQGEMLDAALSRKRFRLAKKLIAAGAPLDSKDEDGKTLIQRALECGNWQLAEFLLKNGVTCPKLPTIAHTTELPPILKIKSDEQLQKEKKFQMYINQIVEKVIKKVSSRVSVKEETKTLLTQILTESFKESEMVCAWTEQRVFGKKKKTALDRSKKFTNSLGQALRESQLLNDSNPEKLSSLVKTQIQKFEKSEKELNFVRM